MNKKTTSILASVSAAAFTVSLMAGAGAASAGPLPGGIARDDLGGGTTMVARLVNERVDRGAGNVANVPTSREVWVSGEIRVAVSGAATGGVISGGYVVGCQVDLSAGLSNSGGATVTETAATATAGSTLTLGPGKAAFVSIINQPNYSVDADNPFANLYGYKFAGNRGAVAYGGQALRVNGCAGYAQARARMKIEVTTGSAKSQTILWGKPFSIG